MPSLRRPLLLAPLLGLLACSLERTAEEWELDRTRVLAIRATPAEPQPGETVSFDALTYSADGELGFAWYMCLGMEMFSTDCAPDEAALAELQGLDWAAMDDEELATWRETAAAAGVLGLEPGLTPSFDVPIELLYALKSEELSEGLSLPIHLLAEPLEPSGAANEREHVLKYLPISLAETPNHNPEIEIVSVDGRHYSAAKSLVARAGESYALKPLPLEGVLETYSFVNSAGVTEERDEEPEYRWYTTGGELDRWASGPPHGGGSDDTGGGGSFFDWVDDGATTWIAPETAGQGTLIVVMLDGRGGMGWRELAWVVE
jgi:hypothetical protein